MRGNPFIYVRLDPQQRDAWRKVAKREGRSLSEYIRAAVNAKIVSEYELHECATCGVLVSDGDAGQHVHAASWQGS